MKDGVKIQYGLLCLLIMIRHPVPKTFTPLHSTSLCLSTLHFISFKLHPTTLHYTSLHLTTLSFGLTPFKFPTAPFHLTSPYFTSHHYTSPHNTTLHYTSPHITTLHLTLLHFTSHHYTSPHISTLHF